ncbi:flavin-containing monooxygenase [Smaragdicoccus niigatensis]|uniref:flavin-containing monooxygenase n=1 Tax=Smaragdicoccus niigatensis TaxID=359359 RepID=UPI00035E80EA|nr:NAD(P)/FAD-dependent oxidoreductase [Smaragdicoccus niigatensis]
MEIEHYDVLIVGAGLSGVGAACRLKELCPDKTFRVLESRQAIGGTWDLFRYPGIRSDSDMYSFGYPFRPWDRREAIGEGADILQYIRDTAAQYDVPRHISFNHRVIDAAWSSSSARWTVTIERTDPESAGSDRVQMTCSFLYWASGYYRYDTGYTPDFPGRERFTGPIIHPQFWDDRIDYAGKRVVVIGSGATAMTLVPNIAKDASHVTMLQRTPTYVIPYPKVDPLAKPLLAVLPNRLAHTILRWKNVYFTAGSWSLSQIWPTLMTYVFIGITRLCLPRGYDWKAHFKPPYKPWDQRLCLVPNGDLFKAIKRGEVSVVTDRIRSFTEHGIELESGSELAADVIVTATGLNVVLFGGATLSVDGEPVRLSDKRMYRGMMLCELPNSFYATGYSNASYNLKADLTIRYVCRLLKHMDTTGAKYCVASPPPSSMAKVPVIALKSGYIERSMSTLPTQGVEVPWRLHQNYRRDIHGLLRDKLDDGVLQFH